MTKVSVILSAAEIQAKNCFIHGVKLARDRQQEFESLLEESVEFHGHLCPGQVIGVRMSMLGLHLIGIDDPKGADRKKLYVVVEIDRCATDAIQSVTGCRLGKRTMGFRDFGIMAATFVNLDSSKAVRIVAKEEAREIAAHQAGHILDKREQQLEAYKTMDDKDLFGVQRVKVELSPTDLPGKPLSRVSCERCGEWIQDRREISDGGVTLCRSCDGQGYYQIIDEIH